VQQPLSLIQDKQDVDRGVRRPVSTPPFAGVLLYASSSTYAFILLLNGLPGSLVFRSIKHAINQTINQAINQPIRTTNKGVLL
jgi:hypothetical protein